MRSMLSSSRGETIMEVMIAVFILSMALTAVLSLVTYTGYGQQVGEQQIVAQQLAREGIEVARNLRDSDFLAGVATTNSLKSVVNNFPDHPLKARFTPASNSWVLDYISTCKTWGFCSIWLSPVGVYSHDSNGALATPYDRFLTTDLICRHVTTGTESLATGDGATCGASAVRVGARVTSEVQWMSKETSKSVKLYEYLYDWK